jgi:radical SAM protein with 4Fe4S-binding SPASM domain
VARIHEKGAGLYRDCLIARRGESMPINSAYVEITDYCNQKCIFCYNQSRTENSMPLEYFVNIVQTLKQKNIHNVILSGGEPTIHPEFIDIVNYLGEQQINFGMATNGLALNDEKINLFKKYDAFIQVSIDTIDPDIYKELHGSDSMQQVVHNLEKLITNQVGTTAAIILTELTSPGLEESILSFKDMGVQTIHVSEIINTGTATGHFPGLKIKDLYPVLVKLYNLQKRIYPETSIDMIEDLIIRLIDPNPELGYCNTMTGNMIQLDMYGNAYRCKNAGSTMFLGNFNDQSLDKIINGADNECFNLNPQQLECSDCEYKFICRGGCRAAAYNITGRLNGRGVHCASMKKFLAGVIREKETGTLDRLFFETEMNYHVNSMNKFTKWV